MGTIQVNTDQLRELSKRFMECNEYIQHQLLPELQRISVATEHNWAGTSRVRYDELFQHWLQTALTLERWGEDIGQHVSLTAQQFDEADHSL